MGGSSEPILMQQHNSFRAPRKPDLIDQQQYKGSVSQNIDVRRHGIEYFGVRRRMDIVYKLE
jgi:hypothetical protein